MPEQATIKDNDSVASDRTGGEPPLPHLAGEKTGAEVREHPTMVLAASILTMIIGATVLVVAIIHGMKSFQRDWQSVCFGVLIGVTLASTSFGLMVQWLRNRR